MRKNFLHSFIVLMILIPLSISTNEPNFYQEKGIKFIIPANWSIDEVEHSDSTQFDGSPINDTKIVLSDGISVIRIDTVEIPQIEWLMSFYKDVPFYVVGVLESFYRNDVVRIDRTKERLGLLGGSGFDLNPDNAEETSFRFGPNDNLTEWSIVWLKPEYHNKFIGVHALYQGNYSGKELKSIIQNVTIPDSLYEILDSFTAK